MKMNSTIYLDNAASTQPLPSVVDAVLRACREVWHNPNSAYREALAAEAEIKRAKDAILRRLGAPERKVILTSGGTEAANLAMLGLTLPKKRDRVLVSSVEHPAVMATLPELRARGLQVVQIPVTPQGVVDLEAFYRLLDERVALVSVMQVNNEVGAVEPIEAIMSRAKAIGAVTVVDGVQGFGRSPLRLADIDAYVLSAHKIHGLKGAGALACAPGARLTPRMLGGGQEDGHRSGTQNLPGIMALGAAVEALDDALPQRLLSMKQSLWAALSEALPSVIHHGPSVDASESAPHILSIAVPGTRGEVLLHALEERGVLVSTGSACSSRKGGVSASLAATGAPHAEGTLRFSLGALNVPEEMEPAAHALRDAVSRYFS